MPTNFKIILDADIKVISNVNLLELESIKKYTESLVKFKEKLELKLLKKLDNSSNRISILNNLKNIDHDLAKIYNEYIKDLSSDQKDVSSIQYDSEVQALNQVTKVRPEFGSFKALPNQVILEMTKNNRIIDYIDSKGNKRKINIEREIKKLKGLTVDSFDSAIRSAILEGKNSRIVGKEISKNLDSVISKSVAQTKSLTRTTMFNVLNRAKDVAEKDFKSVITSYMWVSVLDLRVTFICASLNGRIEKNKGDFPFGPPPINWNCRSNIIPLTSFSDTEEVKRRFSIANEKSVNHRDKTKSTKFTPIKSQTGVKTFKNPKSDKKSLFDEWFKDLDEGYQKKWLGEGKFNIYKTNGLNTSDLINSKGKVLSVKEIRKNLNLD